ncbi:MAG: DUF2490 domain-containing protein [Coxiellaceae bacterium]|nr:DUF2490 domain-containing protein [Coxiellaceae bacterium]
MRALVRIIVLFIFSCVVYAGSAEQQFMQWTDLAWQNFTPSGTDYTVEMSNRFLDQRPTYHQGLLRAGVGHSFSSNVAAWVGYAFVPTQPVGTDHFIYEQRSWQQLSWTAVSKPHIGIILRSRLEQRFPNNHGPTAWRLRQRILFDKGEVLDFLPEYFSPVVYDEIMFNLNHPQWVGNNTLNQNRIFIGVSTPIKHKLVLQVGYINQYIFLNPIDVDNHIFSLSLTWLQ